MATEFLFASFDSKPPHSTRKQHIKTVYDLLHLSILRRDYERARRCWSILIRCPEFEARRFWKIGLGLLLDWRTDGEDFNDDQQSLGFLRSSMLREKEGKEGPFVEIILLLIKRRRFREALDDLELYLPAFPYQDNPVLHVYAGLIKLFLAQPENERQKDLFADEAIPTSLGDLDQSSVQAAQTHFQKACELDPENAAARSFLGMLRDDEKALLVEDEGPDVSVNVIGPSSPPRKRLRPT